MMDVAERSEYIGRTEAVSFVDLRARVSGFLTSRNFQEGADVKTGDLLYVIEQEPYRIAVDIAAAAVAQTEANLENSERFLERLRSVEATGGASQANLDSARKSVVETRALLEERRARLAQAQLNLDYTEIRAPMSGRIGRTAYHAGNLVGPESGVLASIIQLDPIWVSFPVSERVYLELQRRAASSNGRQPAMVPTLRLADGSVYGSRGRLDFQELRMSPDTGTILLRAVFPNPALLLRPGQFVTVIKTEQVATPRILVPQAAVQRYQVGPFVLTVDGESKAVVRRIVLGEEVDGSWTVMEGIEAGEWVISEGLQKVTPGSPVKAAPANPEGAAGAE
jgi:membrane fusion protein (multidrug efflux system)